MTTTPVPPSSASPAPVEWVDDDEALARRAAALAQDPDPAAPVPVVRGGRVDEAAAGRARFAAGSAVAVAGDDAFAALAALLAARSGRPLLRFATVREALAAEHDGALTVVAPPREVTPDLLAAIPPGRPVGLLTARDLRALSALVHRTLHQAPVERVTHLGVRWDQGMRGLHDAGRLEGEAATVDALRGALAGGVDLLTVAAHGREDALLLQDGVICGRAAEAPLPDVTSEAPGAHPAACQLGQGCFRMGWSGSRLLLARDLEAAVLVADSCRTLRVAGGELNPSVSLALAALDGRPVAFVGAVWVREGAPGVPALLSAALQSGRALGDAVVAVNAAVDHAGDAFGHMAVMGDAGLLIAETEAEAERVEPIEGVPVQVVLDELEPSAVVEAERPPRLRPGDVAVTLRTAPGEHTLVRRSAAEAVTVEVEPGAAPRPSLPARRLTRALARLRELRWLGVPPVGGEVDALEDALAELTPDPEGRAAYGALPGRFDELQERVVDRVLTDVVASVWAYTGDWAPHFDLSRHGTARCPICGSPELRVLHYEHRAVDGLRQRLDLCPLCTEVYEGPVDPAFGWAVEGPRHVRRGEPFTQELVLRSTVDHELRCVAGAAIRNERFHDASMRALRPVVLRPGEPARVSFTASFPLDGTPSDMHYVKYLVLAEGRLHVLSRSVWLLPARAA